MTSGAMRVRPATLADIAPMHRIRLSVSQNRLDDPTRISEQSYAPYIADGSAWLAEIDGAIAGFAIIDMGERSVWALFVDPAAEGQGIGRSLHDQMISWARDEGLHRLSLTTAADSRAANFYRASGWSQTGTTSNGDLRFARDV